MSNAAPVFARRITASFKVEPLAAQNIEVLALASSDRGPRPAPVQPGHGNRTVRCFEESDGRFTKEGTEMKSSASARKMPKILVADDDPCVLEAVADCCSRMGFAVETASNGLQVLAMAGQWKPDVLILDVHMPEVDGLSALGYLRENACKPVHVMIVTGNPGREIMQACEGFDVSCIRKGRGFWAELETCLVMLYPQQAAEIRRSRKGSACAEVKKHPRVLLVDDDIGVKNFFFHHFEKLGAELLYASDGVMGYWKARRFLPTVIVADYCMPNGDAEYLLNRLRDTPETWNIPVIVQSGRCLSDPVKQRLRQPFGGQPGAARILQKSFDVRELFEVLQRLCGFTSDLDGHLLYR
jgi:CheY-like chemotaxis protein